MEFAARTKVSVSQSRDAIERLLKKYGAHSFQTGTYDPPGAKALFLGARFTARTYRVSFLVPLPPPSDQRFTHVPQKGGKLGPRPGPAAALAYEQEYRRLWRSLYLLIRAKFEAIESSISSFEDEFMAHFELPGGARLGERIRPQLGELLGPNGHERLALLPPSDGGQPS